MIIVAQRSLVTSPVLARLCNAAPSMTPRGQHSQRSKTPNTHHAQLDHHIESLPTVAACCPDAVCAAQHSTLGAGCASQSASARAGGANCARLAGLSASRSEGAAIRQRRHRSGQPAVDRLEHTAAEKAAARPAESEGQHPGLQRAVSQGLETQVRMPSCHLLAVMLCARLRIVHRNTCAHRHACAATHVLCCCGSGTAACATKDHQGFRP